MKILIAEENVAIHEILDEILKSEEFEIIHAYTVENAKKNIEEFDPDIVILDTLINGENGLDVIRDYDEESKLCAIILTMDLNFTSDNPLIIGTLHKPFKAKDILRCIKKKNHIRRKNAKGKRVTDKNIKRPDIKFGTHYVVFEKKANYVYKLASVFSDTCQVVVFTKYSKSKINKKIRGHPTVYVLSDKIKAKTPLSDVVDVSKLGTLLSMAKNFSSDKLQPVIVFDDLRKIMYENGTNATLTLIHQIMEDTHQTVIVSANREDFTFEEMNSLLSEMKEYVVE